MAERSTGTIRLLDPMDVVQTIAVSFGSTGDYCEFCDRSLDGKPCMVFMDELAETTCLSCIESMFETGDLRRE